MAIIASTPSLLPSHQSLQLFHNSSSLIISTLPQFTLFTLSLHGSSRSISARKEPSLNGHPFCVSSWKGSLRAHFSPKPIGSEKAGSDEIQEGSDEFKLADDHGDRDPNDRKEESSEDIFADVGKVALAIGEILPPEGFVVFVACIVGVLTGLSVVLFNLTVGMAATLAGVCQVPLTSVLLLFELTHDYRIIIPLMGAVGFSSWISSALTRKNNEKLNDKKSISSNVNRRENKQSLEEKPLFDFHQSKNCQSSSLDIVESLPMSKETVLHRRNLCQHESSLCMDSSNFKEEQLEEMIPVGAAMRTRYVTVFQHTSLQDAMALMLAEKEWCALVVDSDNYLKGILTLGDIQRYGKMEKARASNKLVEVGKVPVSEVCTSWNGGGKGLELLTVFPHSNLKEAQRLMAVFGLRQLPVVAEAASQVNQMGPLVGLLDRECINLACRAEATKWIVDLP